MSDSEARKIAPQPWMVAPPTRAVIEALADAGIAARFVGGCVRDRLGNSLGEGAHVEGEAASAASPR